MAVGDDLYHAAGLSIDQRSWHRIQRQHGRTHVMADLASGSLDQADGPDSRARERHSWYCPQVNRAFIAKRVLRRHTAFVSGDVDELRRKRHITDGADARIAGAQVLVHDDLSPRTSSHTRAVEP